MKGKFKKCIVLLISFIIFSLSLNLSSNVKAVDLTQLVQYVGTWDVTHNPSGSTTCVPSYQPSTSTISAFWYVSNSGQSPCAWNDSVLSLGSLGFNDKYIFQVDYYLYDYRDKEEINSYANQPPTLRMDNGRFPLNYIGADYKMMDSDSAVISYYFNIPYTDTLSTGDNFRIITNIGLQTQETIAMSNKMTIWSYYQAAGGSGGGGNYTQIINAINTVNSTIDSWSNTQTHRLDSILQLIRENQSAAAEQQQQDQEDRENIEDQQSDISTDSDSSQQSAETTGTTLLGAFSAFVSAITNASPSNCNLDMDLGNLDLGVVNLCQLSLPQPIPSIASIMLILFCVPLSIATARKVINLFRSFQ